MNMILLFSEDFVGPTRVRLNDYRAEHIREIHRAPLGKTLKVGLANGGVGDGTLVAMEDGAVTLEVSIPDTVPETPRISLVLALPRPQTLKKVLETIGAFGLKRLCLINTDRVQKSFFSSKLLKERAWMKHLRLGMEQGGRTYLPEINVEPSLTSFLSKFDESFPQSVRLIAHPGQKSSLWDADLKPDSEIMCALGPEGGWLDPEVEAFCAKGFLPVRLGETVHRVENAVTALLAQVEFLRMR